MKGTWAHISEAKRILKWQPNVSIEECSNLLSSIAERFYSGEDDEINPSFLEMEELINGRME